jgi:uncharacterized protein YdcH (DUF465 family)
MYEARIAHLEEAHRALDKQIDTLERTGVFGDANLQTLKKQRLALRDQIQIMKRRQWEHEHETLDMDDDR